MTTKQDFMNKGFLAFALTCGSKNLCKIFAQITCRTELDEAQETVFLLAGRKTVKAFGSE